MNPSSLSWFNLKVQKPACRQAWQKSMNRVYELSEANKDTMLLRMRAHRTPFKIITFCEVTGTGDFSYKQLTIN